MRRDYTVKAMREALVVGWGSLGGCVADTWVEFNQVYFGGRLKPLPVFLTPATPYGRLVGWTCCQDAVTHIALARPRQGDILVADKSTLLHEMVHQSLHESGENICHAGEPWCREIMRLHKQITGKEIWAGKYTVLKKKLPDGSRVSVRGNRPHPVTGQPSIPQKAIASWPYGAGIGLGWFAP
jgi:hypothetical protein